MGHRLSRPRQRSSPHRHEGLENLSPRREFHHRLRSKRKHLHDANGVGKHQRLGRHQIVWSAAVLCTLSLEGPPLSQRKQSRADAAVNHGLGGGQADFGLSPSSPPKPKTHPASAYSPETPPASR